MKYISTRACSAQVRKLNRPYLLRAMGRWNARGALRATDRDARAADRRRAIRLSREALAATATSIVDIILYWYCY